MRILARFSESEIEWTDMSQVRELPSGRTRRLLACHLRWARVIWFVYPV
jgi:hypothetical protein